MISISEVLEEAAQIIDQQDVDPAFKHRMSSHIRALAAKYEGCIVAEGLKAGALTRATGLVPLYRAKEPK
jgi:hypothetical protein